MEENVTRHSSKWHNAAYTNNVLDSREPRDETPDGRTKETRYGYPWYRTVLCPLPSAPVQPSPLADEYLIVSSQDASFLLLACAYVGVLLAAWTCFTE
ncbi:hypothetical protein E2C01_081952 [Portunus trituberculatus]|uniref:Uncharacterized protein n=1 Tax=Portunus trituberculatus TaxID=210409 RepID=A0A5B7INQ0_PORTR|nr:hypothetical protein [Portunus trituberculatus]